MSEFEQIAALNLLDYIRELFAASGKESFTPAQIVAILETIKHDPEIFEIHVVAAQEEAMAEVLGDALPN